MPFTFEHREKMGADMKRVIARLVELLVAGDYKEVVRMTGGVRLDAESIRKAITQYGRALVLPPESAYEQLDVIEIQDAVPQKWSLNLPLWTVEEGRSELTLSATVVRTDETFSVELDDIHVL
jgi:hypothetical protein